MNATVLLTGATEYTGGRPLRQFEEGGRADPVLMFRAALGRIARGAEAGAFACGTMEKA